MIGIVDEKQELESAISSKPILNGHIKEDNDLTGFIIQRPVLSSVETTKKELEGKMNIGVKSIKEMVSFMPYVENEILFFKAQASVEESELIISG